MAVDSGGLKPFFLRGLGRATDNSQMPYLRTVLVPSNVAKLGPGCYK